MKPRSILLTFCITACAALAVFVWQRRTSVPVCRDCNVIVIAVDPLRADALHVSGNPLPVTPALDAVAKKSYIFSNAFTASSWALPSAMSLFTSTYPMVHRIINKDLVGATPQEGTRSAKLTAESPNIRTMASVFRAAGYATGGFAGGRRTFPIIRIQ